MKNLILISIILMGVISPIFCFDNIVYADTGYVYYIPDSWFIVDGISYDKYYEYDYPPNAQFFSIYYGGNNIYASSDEPPIVVPLDGENDVDVGLYQLWSGVEFTYYNMTVYYRHGDKESFETYIVNEEGATITNSSTYESIFTSNGYGEEYTYAGNRDGWTIGGGSDPAAMPLYTNPFDFGENSYFMEMPHSYSYFAMPSSIIVDSYTGENPTCEDYLSRTYIVCQVTPYILVRQYLDDTSIESYGGLMGFNTSGIPDDAVVMSATLHLCPFYWDYDNESPQTYVVGGTYNNSFVPIVGAFEISIDDLYGDFAEFTTSDIPICMGDSEECANWNQSVYMDIPLNADGLFAVDKSGLTRLSVRLLDSINGVCPIGNTLVDSVFFTTYELPEGQRGVYPQSWLTVNWENTIVISSGSGSATVDSMTWLTPVILTAIIIVVSATTLFVGGFSIIAMFVSALFMIIGLSMISTLTNLISNMW